LNQLFESLIPKEQTFIELYFLKEWSPEEVADFFKIDVNTIYVQKFRILEKLKKIAQKKKLIDLKE